MTFTMTTPMWAFAIFTVAVTIWALVTEERQIRRRERDRHQEWLRPDQPTHRRTYGRHW